MIVIDTRRDSTRQATEPGDLNDAILKRGRRPGATSPNRAVEVERSGDPERIRLAALRLKNSERLQKVLQVPHSQVALAAYIMGNSGMSGTVKNLSGTRSIRVRKQTVR